MSSNLPTKLIPALPSFRLLLLLPRSKQSQGEQQCLAVRTAVGFLSPGGCICYDWAPLRPYPAAGTGCCYKYGSEFQALV